MQENSDQCEGGGYLLWTALVVCKQVVAIKTTLTVAGALFCLFLFLALAVVAGKRRGRAYDSLCGGQLQTISFRRT